MGRTEALTSPANPLLKDVRRAISRGGLTEQGYMIAETFHLLEEALRSDLEIKVVLAAESAVSKVESQVGRLPDIRIAAVDDGVFQKLGDTEASQGVIALVNPPAWTLEQVLGGQTLAVVLDGVQDPGNAGSIVRAAEAFGATGVIFTKGTVSPFNPKTLRASAGSLFRVPFVQGIEGSAARIVIGSDATIFIALPRGGQSLPDADLRRKCALVIGNEAHGVSNAWRAGTVGVSIPSVGVESLNASVAAGILLYEAQRQRSRP